MDEGVLMVRDGVIWTVIDHRTGTSYCIWIRQIETDAMWMWGSESRYFACCDVECGWRGEKMRQGWEAGSGKGKEDVDEDSRCMESI